MGNKQHIVLASPHMSEEGYEMEYIKKAFATNWIAPLGENVTALEKEVEGKIGVKKAVALSSGTAAIHMALKAVGASKGDLVFCQSLTFAATANPVLYENALPVFIDSDNHTWNMSPAALQKAFEKYKKLGKAPKAVIVVHLYGICAHIEEIAAICKKHNVPLIEDAAESLGTTYHGRYTGTFGDYGIISFNGNKIITTSGGGMLFINTPDAGEKAEKIIFWATQARDHAKWYQHSEVGYNYRMSNVSAGIGRGQLKVLDKRIRKKRWIYEYYSNNFRDLEGICLMPRDSIGCGNCWLTVIQIEKDIGVRLSDMIAALEKENIESRPVWKPLHLQPVFAEYDFISEKSDCKVIDEVTGADNSVSGTIFKHGLCLPSDTKMEEKDMERVCAVIKKLWIKKEDSFNG